MSTYSPYYYGPRHDNPDNDLDYQRWLRARAANLKRRFIWAAVIGAIIPFILIFVIIMVSVP
jgi:hypothetical protein